MPRIFERFYEVDNTDPAPARGVGLVLATVQSILRLHAGAATADRTEGRGTTITLVFPADAAVARPRLRRGGVVASP